MHNDMDPWIGGKIYIVTICDEVPSIRSLLEICQLLHYALVDLPVTTTQN